MEMILFLIRFAQIIIDESFDVPDDFDQGLIIDLVVVNIDVHISQFH